MERGTVRAANPSRSLTAIEMADGTYAVIRTRERVEIGDQVAMEPPRLLNITKGREVTRWELVASQVPAQDVRRHLFPP